MPDTAPPNTILFDALAQDMDALQNGAWVRPSPDQFGPMELKMRGYVHEYHDERDARLRDAVRANSGAPIGSKAMQELLAKLMSEMLLIDVRNVVKKDGSPLTISEFKAAMLVPKFQARLVRACEIAAERVSRMSEEADKELEGNSERSSSES